MTFRVEIEDAEDPIKKEKTEKALGKAFKDFHRSNSGCCGSKDRGTSPQYEKDKKSN